MTLSIYIVEDNADTRSLLTLLLESSGHEVHTAGTVQAALHDYPQWRSQVLISDVGLPDGSGCELLRELRQRGEQPYGIAMTGFGMASDVAESLAAGFRHHLVKPIEIDELERLIRSVPVAAATAVVAEPER